CGSRTRAWHSQRAPGAPRAAPSPRRASTIPARARHRASPVLPRSGFARPTYRLEERLCAVEDRVVDHLAIDLDRRRPARLGLLEGRDDALRALEFLGARKIGAIHRTDLVRMNAQTALEAAAAAALERPLEGRDLLEMEPRTVDRTLEAGRARRKDDARARLRQLRFFDADRQSQLVCIVRGAEGEPLQAPSRLIWPQAARLDDAVDALHPRRRLHLGNEVDRAFSDTALALEGREQPVDRMQVGRAFDLGEQLAVHALVDRRHEIAIAERARGGVDAHIAQAPARARERLGHGPARGFLVRDRDRILEVDD